eukprot:11186961-Lingulodinium_polyedra.AAC.1
MDEHGVRTVSTCLRGFLDHCHRGCGAPCTHGRWYNGRDCPDCQVDSTPVIVPSQTQPAVWPPNGLEVPASAPGVGT